MVLAVVIGVGAFSSCKEGLGPDVPATLLVKATGVTATRHTAPIIRTTSKVKEF